VEGAAEVAEAVVADFESRFGGVAPLGGIKAVLRRPDEKEPTLTSDAEGFVRFSSAQSGQHLLTVAHHREPLVGYHAGQPHQQAIHNAALTWIQP